MKLQLTSPIEEAVLDAASAPEVTFRAVELGQAMLSMSAMDADIALGAADSIDLASLIKLDAMNPSAEYSLEKDVPFMAQGGDADSASTEPVFHATLKIVFTPSAKDQREELYEMLNKATTAKAQAVEQLRQAALAAARSSKKSAPESSSSAVKAGFLNKPKKEEKGIQAFYNKYLGPKSFLRQVFPIAKNYIIFGVAVALFHFKGDTLALPPPV